MPQDKDAERAINRNKALRIYQRKVSDPTHGIYSYSVARQRAIEMIANNALPTQTEIVAHFALLLDEIASPDTPSTSPSMASGQRSGQPIIPTNTKENLPNTASTLSPEGKARILDYVSKAIARRDALMLELMYTKEQIEGYARFFAGAVNTAFGRCWSCQEDLGAQRTYWGELAEAIGPPDRGK